MPQVRRNLRGIAGGALIALTFAMWPLMMAYGDWLRFSAPHAPNYETGQTIYYKGVRGVFYVTQQQNLLIGGSSTLLVWCLGAIGFLLLRSVPQEGWTAPFWLRICGCILFAWWFLLLLAPDHTMSLLLTGSLTPPIDLHRFEPTVVPP